MCTAPLNWSNIVHAVKHEMYAVLATALQSAVRDVQEDPQLPSFSVTDLSKKAVDTVIEKLKKRKALTNREIAYVHDSYTE